MSIVSNNKHKLFTAERRLLERRLRTNAENSDLASCEAVSEIKSMRRELAEMRREFTLLRSHIGGQESFWVQNTGSPNTPHEIQIGTNKKVHSDDVEILKTEIRALATCINKTKLEIATIRPSGDGDDRIIIVSNELDAVVSATEVATQSILDSIEHIEELVQGLRVELSEPHIVDTIDEIIDRLVTVIVSCNFQDITGQRISKVVSALKYIDESVNNMIAIWGPVGSASGDAKSTADEDAHLLNGPQLEGAGYSQDDIDKMFFK